VFCVSFNAICYDIALNFSFSVVCHVCFKLNEFTFDLMSCSVSILMYLVGYEILFLVQFIELGFYEIDFNINLCYRSGMKSCLVRMSSELTPWSESASELHRPSDRRLSAK
jgi:hypothetical protein